VTAADTHPEIDTSPPKILNLSISLPFARRVSRQRKASVAQCGEAATKSITTEFTETTEEEHVCPFSLCTPCPPW
jgi:hypothetical protein